MWSRHYMIFVSNFCWVLLIGYILHPKQTQFVGFWATFMHSVSIDWLGIYAFSLSCRLHNFLRFLSKEIPFMLSWPRKLRAICILTTQFAFQVILFQCEISLVVCTNMCKHHSIQLSRSESHVDVWHWNSTSGGPTAWFWIAYPPFSSLISSRGRSWAMDKTKSVLLNTLHKLSHNKQANK